MNGVIIDTSLNNKQFISDSKTLVNDVKKFAGKFAQAFSSSASTGTKAYDSARQKIVETGIAIEDVRRKMNDIEQAALNSGNSTGKAFENAKQKVDATELALGELDKRMLEMSKTSENEMLNMGIAPNVASNLSIESLLNDPAYKKLASQYDSLALKLKQQKSHMELAKQSAIDSSGTQSAEYKKLEKQLNNLGVKQTQYRSRMEAASGSNEEFSKSSKKTSKSLGGLMNSFVRFGTMLKMMIVRKVMQAVIQSVRDGARDFAQVSAPFNAAMSQMKAGTLQVRNALTSAFAPAIQALAPIVNTITTAIVGLINSFAALSARLFGNSATFYKAKNAAVEYAESVAGVAKANKDAVKQSGTIDELNILSHDSDSAGSSSGMPSPNQMWEEVEIPESTINIADRLKALLEPLKSINLAPLAESFERFKTSLAGFADNVIFAGLEWLWLNILIPLAAWTIEDALPAFLDLLSAGLQALGTVVEVLKPFALWLWDNLLYPFAKWTGGIIVDVIKWLTEKLIAFSSWASANQSTVELIAGAILGFFAGIWIYNTTKNIISFFTNLLPQLAGFTLKLLAMNAPLFIAGAAFALLGAGIVYLGKNWDKMSGGQRALTILGAIAAAALAAFVAVSLFHTGWSVGLAAAAIAAGAAIIIGVSASVKNNSSVPSMSGGGKGGSRNLPASAVSFAGQSFNTSPLPRLASGAVIPPNQEFMAVLGDQKRGVNIETPLETMLEAFKMAMAENGGGGQDVYVETKLIVDGNVLAKAVEKANARTGFSGFRQAVTNLG